MGTRSNIIVARRDGSFARVYCHFDGYPTGVGAILVKHYATQERAEELVAPGDMSCLGPRCDNPEGHSYENRHKDCTVYYGRDRGETDVDAKVYPTLDEALTDVSRDAEYVYVWRDGAWNLVGDPKALRPVAEVLAERAA